MFNNYFQSNDNHSQHRQNHLKAIQYQPIRINVKFIWRNSVGERTIRINKIFEIFINKIENPISAIKKNTDKTDINLMIVTSENYLS